MKTMQYAWNLLGLWVNRKIGTRTFCMAMWQRPMAVCGKGGSYHVDPFDPNVPVAAKQLDN
jgi:hypothetical protein